MAEDNGWMNPQNQTTAGGPSQSQQLDNLAAEQDKNAQTYPLAERTPLSTPEKIEGTSQDDKSSKPLKIYTFPETLDAIPNTNVIIFEIMGEEDIGVDLAQSQRSNGQGLAFLKQVGTNAKDAFTDIKNGATGLWEGATNMVSDNSSSDGLSGLGKGGNTSLNNFGTGMFSNAANATSTNVQNFWDSMPSASDMGFKDPIKKLNIVIKLPMPAGGLTANYGMEYANTPLGLGGALMSGIASGGTLTDILKSSKGAAVRALVGGVAGVLDDFTGGNKAGLNFGGLIEAGTRTVLNPRKEQLFQSVKYRTFNYNFTFAPSNATECKTVLEIIRLFKTHMCPTMEMQGFYMRFPSEFLISYHFNKEANPYLHNIGNCALTDLEISYGRGSFSTLANGSPTSVSLVMSFMELEPLSRNRMEREDF